MKRAGMFALLLFCSDPATHAIAIVRHASVGSRPGFTGQQEQTARYRVSKVTIEGAKAISTDQVTSLSKLKVGQVVNEQFIAKSRGAILRAYAYRGHLKATVAINSDFKSPVPGAKAGVVAVTVEIDEGAVFVLRRLEFSGNATTKRSDSAPKSAATGR